LNALEKIFIILTLLNVPILVKKDITPPEISVINVQKDVENVLQIQFALSVTQTSLSHLCNAFVPDKANIKILF
jgi:hypothetical protein